MKNFFFLTAAVALTAVFAGCTKMDAPDGLGKISFASTKTWKVGSQTWSDAVVASGANNKTNFDGGPSGGPHKADWRNNPGYKGTLFSWEAVNQYKDYLCPDSWRVPTKDDFITLDIALGGIGDYQINATVRDKYLSLWGGVYVGGCNNNGTLDSQGLFAAYWSQSERPLLTTDALALLFSSNDHAASNVIFPNNIFDKGKGLTLRCVKN